MAAELIVDYLLIPLTKGQFAKVSKHRWNELMQWNWHATWDSHTQQFYARRTVVSVRNGKPIVESVRMSRQILGLEYGDPRKGDHINGDTLDNTDGNLRISTNAENQRNKGLQRNNKSGYKGVHKINRKLPHHSDSWIARIRIDGRKIYLGCFSSPQEAHAAYCKAATIHHGEFARFA